MRLGEKSGSKEVEVGLRESGSRAPKSGPQRGEERKKEGLFAPRSDLLAEKWGINVKINVKEY